VARSPLFGRRIHISGSISPDSAVQEVERAREFVEALVKELLHLGACFVIPVDAEPTRPDGLPVFFDWLVWKTVAENLRLRPADAISPLVVAVKHHKNEDQIPPQFASIWGDLAASDHVHIVSAAQWNMASKRMELQAHHGDFLIALGGAEGVQFLANLYHDAGKHVVPLNFKVGQAGKGALRLLELGMQRKAAERLFQTEGGVNAHGWLNRMDSARHKPADDQVRGLIDLLTNLSPPRAFAVRLLDPADPAFKDVQGFFDDVVKPVLVGEMGYKLVVIDKGHVHDLPFIDQEIFAKLHRSQLVVADITGLRPNVFLELGYAFGRQLKTVVTAQQGTKHPFDVVAFGGHHWTASEPNDARRKGFLEHLRAMHKRQPIVPDEPLIP
jgi:hypothetical protein